MIMSKNTYTFLPKSDRIKKYKKSRQEDRKFYEKICYVCIALAIARK